MKRPPTLLGVHDVANDAIRLLCDMAHQFQRLVDAYDGQGWETVQELLARFSRLDEQAGRQ